MPLAALIENKIFCVHGGLSPNLENLDELVKLQRVKEIEHEGVISDILWSDPEEDMEGYRIEGIVHVKKGYATNYNLDKQWKKFLNIINME